MSVSTAPASFRSPRSTDSTVSARSAIDKIAKREGGTRDLSKRVRQEVSAANARQAVELATERGVQVVREHRASLSRAHRIVGKLLDELESATESTDVIEDEIIAETTGDANSQRRNSMLKALALPSRAATARDRSSHSPSQARLGKRKWPRELCGLRRPDRQESIQPPRRPDAEHTTVRGHPLRSRASEPLDVSRSNAPRPARRSIQPDIVGCRSFGRTPAASRARAGRTVQS